MVNYLEEFKNWVNQDESRKNILGITGYFNTLTTVTNWPQYLEIVRGRASFSPQEQCLKTFREWVDQRERERRK